MPSIEALLTFGVMGVVLAISAVTDVRHGKIYNAVTLPTIAVGLIGHTLAGGMTGTTYSIGLVGSAVGLAAGFLPMLAVWLAGGIHAGDVKLMAAVGALGGWSFALEALFFGLLTAAIMAIIAIIKKRIARRTLARLLRFVYLSLTPGKPVDPATAESPKVPFGLALCIGSAAAAADMMLRGHLAHRLFPWM